MGVLILGLVLFLGVHSVRIVGEGWRTRFIAQRGEGAYKGLYTLVSLLGFALICWGFSLARQQPVMLWTPPRGLRHLASLLLVVSFVLLFGSFLAWAVLSFKAARGRDRAAGTTPAPGTAQGTVVAAVAGLGAWAVFAFWAHGFLIGVRPFA